MGCCGEPIDNNAPSNRTQAHKHGMITTQPTAQQTLEKPGGSPPSSYQPTVASPPPAVVNPTPVNGYNGSAVSPMGLTPSPPVQNPYEFGASPSPPLPTSSPGTFTTSSYHPPGTMDSLLRPQTVYYPSFNGRPMSAVPHIPSPPPIDLSNISVPDEGKMSVAVDFGVYFGYRVCSLLIFTRYYFLRCRE